MFNNLKMLISDIFQFMLVEVNFGLKSVKEFLTDIGKEFFFYYHRFRLFSFSINCDYFS